ncbi:hypothetical protein E5347_01920 [Clostridium sartagoforme]|uniref:Uncharacterized protein n=1 Tax=Clostridium sartagoforme TaxID=84031 RepID=A0A4S2DR12_9CLOT|nr:MULTISPECIES: hypothetical protein [Clostridium]MBS5936819.1 hypothetical protein [Clostridium sp.]TGY43594.1 hypothetical protein E5347_01920 [Clostridium sartagoforme]
MKYGLDVNNKNILDEIINYIKESGDFMVNLSEEDVDYNKNINYGKILRKKVLKSNVTNIDFYFKIEFLDKIEGIYIYYSHTEKIERVINSSIGKLMKEPVLIEKKEGENLYLLKNINALGIVLKIPEKLIEKVEIITIKEILKDLKEL